MFNGIVKNTGVIKKIVRSKKNCTIEIKSQLKFTKKEIGSSISCSGICLTLEKFKKNYIKFYLSTETINRSTFKFLKKDDIINLEKSLKFGDRISGHFVQGHVDTTCSVKKILIIGKSWLITFNLSKKFIKYLVQKASITINGVSLTISNITNKGFQIAVIPKTLKLTNLINLSEGDLVNVEFDILSKYIKKFIK